MNIDTYHKKWYWKNRDKPGFLQRHRESELRRLRKDPRIILLRGAKYRAKKTGLPFNLELADIIIPAICPILKMPLELGEKIKGGSDLSPSLDRKVSALGYVKGNVWVISRKANAMKNNANIEELRNFAHWVYQL